LSAVLVVGLAGTGEALVTFLRGAGHDVTVVEDTPVGDAFETRAERARAAGATVLATPGPDAVASVLAGIDLVAPSPGVPPHHPVLTAAGTAGIPIRSEVDLAAEALRARPHPPRLVAVTGTNGKTTVTTLVTEMLVASGIRAVAAGNIGRPLLDAASDDVDVVVAEVSSFQLEYTTAAFAPEVAVLLNVAVDHVDWHGTPAAYVAAKAKVFSHQAPDGVLVVDAHDAVASELARTAPGRVVVVAATAPGHDATNRALATAAAEVAGATEVGMTDALASFTGLPHRLQLVDEVDGVRYVDDSKATNGHAAASALAAFDHVVLIAGGRNRSRDLDRMRIHAPRIRALVTLGEAAGDVAAVFADAVPVIEHVPTMHDAVARAAALAEPGDAVLLSPACASLDMYASYAARGDDFAREVAQLRRRGKVAS
jgi:UDP-N-acetylmuramoylalanine--D-glutamate ligase